VNELTPQQLADLWYLKYEYTWVPREKLDEDWRKIANTLMKNSFLDYEIAGGWAYITPQREERGVSEILRLKGM
jgi:hypothetical protein